jgi:hypothetical protein
MSSAAAPKGYGSLGGATFTLAMDVSTFELGLTTAQKQAETAAAKINKSFESVSHGAQVHGKGAAQGLLQMGYAIDDLQYGFKAIVNNIPQIVLGMGGSMGIAGAVGIAAVGINVLFNHWSELAALLQSAWDGGSAERIKAMADQAEEATAAFEKMTKAKGEFYAKSQAGVLKGVAETGAEDFKQRVTDALFRGQTAKSDKSGFGIFGPGIAGTLYDLIMKPKGKQERTGANAEELIGQTQSADQAKAESARQQLKILMDQNADLFTDEQRKAINESDPKKLKAAEQEKEDKKIIMEEAKAHQEGIFHRRDLEEKIRKENWAKDKEKRMEVLQDRRDALQEEAHQLRLLHQKNPRIFGSWKESLKDIQMGALEQVPKQQLKKLEDIHKKLEDINQAMKGERRAKFN